jgi:hypothetical protein
MAWDLLVPQQKNKNPLRFTVSGLVGNSMNGVPVLGLPC